MWLNNYHICLSNRKPLIDPQNNLFEICLQIKKWLADEVYNIYFFLQF